VTVSKRPVPGFNRFARPSKALGTTGGQPSGFILTDTNNNDYYLWINNAGTLRITDAATAEAAGFDFNAGGTSIGAQT